jgi:hypothetical protein
MHLVFLCLFLISVDGFIIFPGNQNPAPSTGGVDLVALNMNFQSLVNEAAYLDTLPTFDNSACTFKDPQGLFYDLNELNKNDGNHFKKEVPVSGDIKFLYEVNLCRDISTACSGGATETLKIPAGETCRGLGKVVNAKIEAKSAAVTSNNPSGHALSIYYTGGDECGDPSKPEKRHSTLELICNKNLDSDALITQVQRHMTCKTIITLESSHACPVIPSSASGFGFLFLCAMFILIAGVGYVGGGSVYNYYKHDVRGMDVLPHREFWVDVKEKTEDGAQLVLSKLQSGWEMVHGQVDKMRGRKSGSFNTAGDQQQSSSGVMIGTDGSIKTYGTSSEL